MTSTPRRQLTHSLLAAAAFGAALLSLEPGASAQDMAATPTNRFGSQGQFAVTLEDLFGVYSDHASYTDLNNVDHSETSTRFSLLFSTHGGGEFNVTAPASTVGFHYFIIPGLSIGGNIGYESRSGSVDVQVANGTVSQDTGTDSTFIFEPKVGYALMLSDLLGFWFRGGPGLAIDAEYPNAGDTVTENKATYWLFDADALFVVTPVNHLGFYVGPGLDISFTGTYTATARQPNGTAASNSFSSSYHRFKLGFGAIAYF
jgi:hypothetical protein